MFSAISSALQGEGLVEVGGGRDDRVADAVDLAGLHDRVGDRLAVRGADDVGGELAQEVDLLLGEYRDTGLERVGGLLDGVDDPHALAVVAAADGLEDDGEAVALGREGGHVLRIGHDPVPGAGHADRVEPRAHHALVLGVHERVGARAHGDAVRLQGPEVLGGYVFVIEGDHIAAARELAQRVQVAIVADDDFAHDLRRGVLRGVTEELEPDAQRDARLVCHTSELATADHADYGERHSPRVSAAPEVAGFLPLPAPAGRPSPAAPPASAGRSAREGG